MSAPGAESPRPACHEAAQQLALCVEASQCVRDGGSIMACLKAKEAPECERLRTGYYLCRRQQLDMRTRIRGRKYAASADGDDE